MIRMPQPAKSVDIEDLLGLPCYLTSGDASHVLSISPQWVAELRRRHELRPVAFTQKTMPGGRPKVSPLYERAAVEQLAARRSGVGPAQLEIVGLLRGLPGGRR